jgi:Protein of unknown function (DUF2878)
MMSARAAGTSSRHAAVAGLVANLVAFEAAWFACVLGAAHGRPGAGVAVAAAVIGIYLTLSAQPARDALLVAIATAIGLVWDSLMIRLGWIEYAAPGSLPALAPAWILALWALLAITLRVPLRWLHTRLALAALLGAVGGPLSYLAAERLGACRLVQPSAALTALTLAWAAVTPLLLVLARRLDNGGHQPAPAR